MPRREPIFRSRYHLVSTAASFVVSIVVLAWCVLERSFAPAQAFLVALGAAAVISPLLPARARRKLSGDLPISRLDTVHAVGVLGPASLFVAYAVHDARGWVLLLSLAALMLALAWSAAATKRVKRGEDVRAGIHGVAWGPVSWGRVVVAAALTTWFGYLLGLFAYFGTLVGLESVIVRSGAFEDRFSLHVAALAVSAQLAMAVAVASVMYAVAWSMSLRFAARWALFGGVAAVAVDWTVRRLSELSGPVIIWDVLILVPIALTVRLKACQRLVADG